MQISDEDLVHFSIHRTEVGPSAVGEALIGEHLFELCRDHGFWLRPVFRFTSQATGTFALPLSALPPTCPQASSHPRMSPILHPLGDFNALAPSYSGLRNLIQQPALKDAILSCSLPRFCSLLRSKAPKLFVDVCVTVGDLNVFSEPISPSFSVLDPDSL
jgi:hypothetical protein